MRATAMVGEAERENAGADCRILMITSNHWILDDIADNWENLKKKLAKEKMMLYILKVRSADESKQKALDKLKSNR